MESLRIDFLPKHLQKEIQDYYEFLISKYQKELVDNSSDKKRPYALAKNEFEVPANFNEPLPEDIINDFYK